MPTAHPGLIMDDDVGGRCPTQIFAKGTRHLGQFWHLTWVPLWSHAVGISTSRPGHSKSGWHCAAR